MNAKNVNLNAIANKNIFSNRDKQSNWIWFRGEKKALFKSHRKKESLNITEPSKRTAIFLGIEKYRRQAKNIYTCPSRVFVCVFEIVHTILRAQSWNCHNRLFFSFSFNFTTIVTFCHNFFSHEMHTIFKYSLLDQEPSILWWLNQNIYIFFLFEMKIKLILNAKPLYNWEKKTNRIEPNSMESKWTEQCE